MRKEDTWKIVLTIIGLIGITILPLSICSFTKTVSFPASFSGTFIKDINKTIFEGNKITFSEEYPIYICKGELNKYKRYDNINREKDNCEHNIINEGTTYENLIENIIIKRNNNQFEITQKGLFCFSNRII